MLHAFECRHEAVDDIADMCNAYDTLDADCSRNGGLTGLAATALDPVVQCMRMCSTTIRKKRQTMRCRRCLCIRPQAEKCCISTNAYPKVPRAWLRDRGAFTESNYARDPSENIYASLGVGDLLIWDQRSTIHRGAGDFPPDERRVKIRAIVEEFD